MIYNGPIYFYQKMSDYAKALNTVSKVFMLVKLIESVLQTVFEPQNISLILADATIKFTACLILCGMTNQLCSFAEITKRSLLVIDLPPMSMTHLLMLT